MKSADKEKTKKCGECNKFLYEDTDGFGECGMSGKPCFCSDDCNEKRFRGKAIYNPSGKALEYAKYACNFYNGCSNGCTYCYLKKGIGKAILGGDKPTLKKCFKDEAHALEIFEKELKANLSELRKHGLFFTFTSDPCLPETIKLTMQAIITATLSGVSVKMLTKRAEWVDNFLRLYTPQAWENNVAFGFTLTGNDELEPCASPNAERIQAMRKLHEAGFKTFASIEPIIDFESSKEMIEQTWQFCNLYKIGIESGKKYKLRELKAFVGWVNKYFDNTIYFKDSLLKAAGIDRADLPSNCVGRDYNLFNG